jgi:hypothetical protein
MSGGEESSALMQHSPNALSMQNQQLVETIDAALYSSALFRITLDPVLCILLKFLAVFAVFVGDGGLDRIVHVWLNQKRLDQAQNSNYLIRRLPRLRTKQPEAHGALVIVGHVRVVDLCPKADDRRFKRIFVGEVDLELEVAALSAVSSC